MKILVTGANGFIGRAMVRYIHMNVPAAEIVGVLRKLPADTATLRFRPTTEVESGDILIHLAGRSGIPQSFKDPAGAFESEAREAIAVMDAAHSAGIGTVVLASTCALYPRGPEPSKEYGELSLQSPYAKAKRLAEIYGQTASDLADFDVRSVRLANIYGRNQRRHMIYEVAMRARENKTVRMASTGEERRDFLHIDDTVHAIWTVATKGRKGEIYNVGSGTPRRVREVAKIICEAYDAELEAPTNDDRRRDGSDDAFPDISALRALGFRPKVSFEAGLHDTLDWIRQEN